MAAPRGVKENGVGVDMSQPPEIYRWSIYQSKDVLFFTFEYLNYLGGWWTPKGGVCTSLKIK